jgi:hypothetical protein
MDVSLVHFSMLVEQFETQMILAEKVMNTKVEQLIKIYNFYIGHFFIWQSDNNIVHKCYTSFIRFHKLYETCVSFMNNVY